MKASKSFRRRKSSVPYLESQSPTLEKRKSTPPLKNIRDEQISSESNKDYSVELNVSCDENKSLCSPKFGEDFENLMRKYCNESFRAVAKYRQRRQLKERNFQTLMQKQDAEFSNIAKNQTAGRKRLTSEALQSVYLSLQEYRKKIASQKLEGENLIKCMETLRKASEVSQQASLQKISHIVRACENNLAKYNNLENKNQEEVIQLRKVLQKKLTDARMKIIQDTGKAESSVVKNIFIR